MRGPGKLHVLAIRQVSGSALPIGAGKSENDRQLRKPSHLTLTYLYVPKSWYFCILELYRAHRQALKSIFRLAFPCCPCSSQ